MRELEKIIGEEIVKFVQSPQLKNDIESCINVCSKRIKEGSDRAAYWTGVLHFYFPDFRGSGEVRDGVIDGKLYEQKEELEEGDLDDLTHNMTYDFSRLRNALTEIRESKYVDSEYWCWSINSIYIPTFQKICRYFVDAGYRVNALPSPFDGDLVNAEGEGSRYYAMNLYDCKIFELSDAEGLLHRRSYKERARETRQRERWQRPWGELAGGGFALFGLDGEEPEALEKVFPITTEKAYHINQLRLDISWREDETTE